MLVDPKDGIAQEDLAKQAIANVRQKDEESRKKIVKEKASLMQVEDRINKLSFVWMGHDQEGITAAGSSSAHVISSDTEHKGARMVMKEG